MSVLGFDGGNTSRSVLITLWGVVIFLVLGLISIAGWFIWQRMTQKRFAGTIFERRADGGIKRTGAVVIRKNQDKVTGNFSWWVKVGMLSKMASITEPGDICIELVGNKERINLIKHGNAYIPLKVKIVDNTVAYEPMSYDVDTFRINEGNSRKAKYKQDIPLWVYLAPLGAIALTVILIIAVAFIFFNNLSDISASLASQNVEASDNLRAMARYNAYVSSNCVGDVKGLPVIPGITDDEPLY